MDYLELDKKLIYLKEKYQELEDEYWNVAEEIQDLQDQQENLECEMNYIEKRIKEIKKQQHVLRIKNINNTFTGDKFTDDFIIASSFCSQDFPQNNIITNVFVGENELMASDGCKAIIIKNNDIPKELRNTCIKWDVREDFKNNINTEYTTYTTFIDIQKIFNNVRKENFFVEQDIKVDEFYSKFNIKEHSKSGSIEIIKIECLGVKIALNKMFLDTALAALRNKNVEVRIKNSTSPILLENNEVSILILPIRVTNL